MKKPTHWLCRNCKKLKKLGEEIARADAGAWCKACQSGQSSQPIATHHAEGSDRSDAPAIVRRNGRDRRDIE